MGEVTRQVARPQRPLEVNILQFILCASTMLWGLMLHAVFEIKHVLYFIWYIDVFMYICYIMCKQVSSGVMCVFSIIWLYAVSSKLHCMQI